MAKQVPSKLNLWNVLKSVRKGVVLNTTANAMNKRKFLIALPSFPCKKNFNHETILVSAKDEADAIDLVFHLRPDTRHIGKIKEVNY